MNPRVKGILIKYRKEVEIDIVIEVKEKRIEEKKIEDEEIWNKRLERIRKKFGQD